MNQPQYPQIKAEDFRKSIKSNIEEITRDEYFTRQCDKDFTIECSDDRLYFKEKKHRYSSQL